MNAVQFYDEGYEPRAQTKIVSQIQIMMSLKVLAKSKS